MMDKIDLVGIVLFMVDNVDMVDNMNMVDIIDMVNMQQTLVASMISKYQYNMLRKMCPI